MTISLPISFPPHILPLVLYTLILHPPHILKPYIHRFGLCPVALATGQKPCPYIHTLINQKLCTSFFFYFFQISHLFAFNTLSRSIYMHQCMCKSPRAAARFFSFFLFSQKKKKKNTRAARKALKLKRTDCTCVAASL